MGSSAFILKGWGVAGDGLESTSSDRVQC